LVDTIAPIEQLEIPTEAGNQLPEVLPLKEPANEAASAEIEVAENNSPEISRQTLTDQPAVNTEAITDDVEKAAEPVINIPNLVDLNLDHTEVEESIDVPSAALAQDGLVNNNVVAVETARKDSNMFHYQYYSGKLYLYGDFRDNPYEILELNSASGKRLFIYYNNAYYRIADDQHQITPLVQLTDRDIIKKLEIIQANK